jgi:dTDP-4-dehydrorhamnose reductase
MLNTINGAVVNAQNVLVTGAGGQLGSELQYLSGNFQDNKSANKKLENIKNFNFMFVTRMELDIQDSQQVEFFCKTNKIGVIINCAAYTAVDKAEQEPEQANAINHLAVKNLAQISKDQSIKLIHISTDYVFDGTNHKPYKESNKTNPKSVYGKTKLDGELAMQVINPANSIIIRTSWVYSEFGHNFVKTMMRLGQDRDEISVVADQVGTPTNARDLAVCILDIIPQLNRSGLDDVEIFHFSNAGVCSWYDFAIAIFEINSIECKVNPIPSESYPTPAERPFYSVMNKSKILEVFKIKVQNWRESLGDSFLTDG